MPQPMTTSHSEPLSLYQIESDLAQLCEERDRADSEGDSEAVAVMDGLIAGYLTREAAKIDSGCALIRSDYTTIAVLRQEAERLLDRAKAFQARVDRIKRAWCEAMAAQSIKELKSQHNTIRRVRNGGVRPVVVKDAAALPLECRRIKLTMSFETWLEIRPRDTDGIQIEIDADTAAIRAALERGETIPGCELGERGEHLRLS